jgi:hypothetical protein
MDWNSKLRLRSGWERKRGKGKGGISGGKKKGGRKRGRKRGHKPLGRKRGKKKGS